MDATLINPSFGGRVAQGRHNRAWPPLDLLNLAGLLKKAGFTPRLFDLRARPDRTGAAIRAGRTSITILTSSPLDRWQCPNPDPGPVVDLARKLNPERLILTGLHGTVFPEEMLKKTGCLAVVRGEPEVTAAEAALCLAKGKDLIQVRSLSYRRGEKFIPNPDREPTPISALPPPDYSLIDLADYGYELLGPRMALVETGRGCPFSCPYCLKAMYPPGIREKPIEAVLDEVQTLIRDHGAKSLYFFDLEFASRKKAVIQLCQGLHRRNLIVPWACQTRIDTLDPKLLRVMAQAGCRLIHFGVETADEGIQNESAKQIDRERTRDLFRLAGKIGIKTAAFFLIGLPGRGPREARRTAKLARYLNPTFASFHAHTPYPTTDWGLKAYDWSSWAQDAADQEARWKWRTRRSYLGFYLRPRYIWSILRGHAGLDMRAALKLWMSFIK